MRGKRKKYYVSMSLGSQNHDYFATRESQEIYRGAIDDRYGTWLKRYIGTETNLRTLNGPLNKIGNTQNV